MRMKSYSSLSLLAIALLLCVSCSRLMEKRSFVRYVVSDENTKWSYSEQGSWQKSFLCYVHPSWQTNGLGDAKWIWAQKEVNTKWEYDNVPDGGWYFKREFKIPNSAEDISGSIDIGADNDYQLFINGRLVDRGMSNELDYEYSKFEQRMALGKPNLSLSRDGRDFGVPTYLEPRHVEVKNFKKGSNLILIRAINFGSSGSYMANPAGLIFSAKISYTN